MKHIVCYCALLIITWSCSVKKETGLIDRKVVNITSLSVPGTAAVQQPVEIKATAEANNACWHDFRFKLTKESDFRYSLKADAVYESKGMCAAVIVNKDTTITFTPVRKGTYIITANEAPFQRISDTLIVN